VVKRTKGEAGWKRRQLIVRKIDFEEVYVAFNIIKLLDVRFALRKNEHFHIFGLLYAL
jgi:hypothetical protein